MRRGGIAALLLVACAAAGLLAAVLVAASPTAGADTGTTGTTDTTTTATVTTTTATTPTTTTSTTPAPPRRPQTIPAGVTIARVLVGGLSPAEARSAVQVVFQQPLTVLVGKRKLHVLPRQLGAESHLGDAIAKARVSPPGRNVALAVDVPRAKVERWIRNLAAKVDRGPVDSRLFLRNLQPVVTKSVPGRKLEQLALRKAIVTALKTHSRAPIAAGFDELQAELTPKTFGPVIVIHRGSNHLYLYDGTKLTREFGVATGQARYPTPLGRFEIVVKWRNPTWTPPDSPWAAGAQPIPPGPGNPLGTRWMGLSAPGVGIHGTPDPASIGYSASHGCIRMLIPQAEWLFEHVDIGTPVFIVSA